MSEVLVRDTLSGIRSALNRSALYPNEHPSVQEAIAGAANSSTRLVMGSREPVLTVLGDSLYLGRHLLAHTSLQYNGFIRTLQSRGIDSITFEGRVTEGDVTDLVSFLSGAISDVPAQGTIRLNQSEFTDADLETAGEGMSGIRRSYAQSLDVLRGVGHAVGAEQEFDLTGATMMVEQLVEQTLSQPGPSVLLSSMKSHDEYTFYHSVNVCILAISIGREIGMDDTSLQTMALGALMHDIGKLRVDAAILQYPGRLDSEQWAEIKLHPQEGATAILAAAAPGQEIAAVVALQHHSRFDGAGYPSGITSQSQHLYSRVVTAADVYDALTTRRSYRRADTPNQALEVLRQGMGGHFDPQMVEAFVHFLGVFPPGSLLELNDGNVVMVTRTVESGPPETVLVKTAAGELIAEPVPHRLDLHTEFTQVTPGDAEVDPASLLESVTQIAGAT